MGAPRVATVQAQGKPQPAYRESSTKSSAAPLAEACKDRRLSLTGGRWAFPANYIPLFQVRLRLPSTE